MKNKSYAVIGLGQFGMTVALTLAEANCDVLAIDDKDDNVQDIAEKVSYAVKADVRDPGVLESLGVQNADVAVIAVAENMEASITATMQVKELGVPFVMAKAMLFTEESLRRSERIRSSIRNTLWESVWQEIYSPVALSICSNFLPISAWRNLRFHRNG